MSFASQSWKSRYAAMGDEAEAKWEEVAHEYVGIGPEGIACSTKVGLSRPPFSVSQLPSNVRCLPDFVTPLGWVEVQGVGRDQKVKVKVEKAMDMLARATPEFPVFLFVWDSHVKRHGWINSDRLFQIIDKGEAELNHFPEGKAYFSIPCSTFFGEPAKKPRRRNRKAHPRSCKRVPNVTASWTPKQDFAGGDDAGTPLFRQGFPETELQALMETAPGQTPRPTKQQMQDHDAPLHAALMAGMEHLDPIERIIITAFFWEGDGAHTLQERLTQLRDEGLYQGPVAHSHIQRIYAEALVKLRANTTNPYEQEAE